MDDQDKTKAQLVAELAALRESKERFRKVFEEGPIGVVLVGTDGRIQHCNRRLSEECWATRRTKSSPFV